MARACNTMYALNLKVKISLVHDDVNMIHVVHSLTIQETIMEVLKIVLTFLFPNFKSQIYITFKCRQTI